MRGTHGLHWVKAGLVKVHTSAGPIQERPKKHHLEPTLHTSGRFQTSNPIDKTRLSLYAWAAA